MIYVFFKNSLPVHFAETEKITDHSIEFDQVESRWDWNSFERVTELALRLTVLSGKTFLPIDSSPNVSPRFDIILAPVVGDEISYGFNGDYYPCGKIARITKNFMVVSSTGEKFNRNKKSGSWGMVGGTWSMVRGHISKRNQEF